METAVSWFPGDGSSSMVVDRSQTTLSRELHSLLLGGLESDRAGILDDRLLALQSRELGIGVTLLATSSVALSLLRLTALAGMILSGILALLEDGWAVRALLLRG